jgi:hypothetical protein
MGVHAVTKGTNTLVNTTIPTTTETLVCLLTFDALPIDFAQVLLIGQMLVIPGTATTLLQARIRQGNGTTGTSVGIADITGQTVGSGTGLCVLAIDTPGAVAGMQYSLTITQISATGAGSVNNATFMGFIL